MTLTSTIDLLCLKVGGCSLPASWLAPKYPAHGTEGQGPEGLRPRQGPLPILLSNVPLSRHLPLLLWADKKSCPGCDSVELSRGLQRGSPVRYCNHGVMKPYVHCTVFLELPFEFSLCLMLLVSIILTHSLFVLYSFCYAEEIFEVNHTSRCSAVSNCNFLTINLIY